MVRMIHAVDIHCIIPSTLLPRAWTLGYEHSDKNRLAIHALFPPSILYLQIQSVIHKWIQASSWSMDMQMKTLQTTNKNDCSCNLGLVMNNRMIIHKFHNAWVKHISCTVKLGHICTLHYVCHNEYCSYQYSLFIYKIQNLFK